MFITSHVMFLMWRQSLNFIFFFQAMKILSCYYKVCCGLSFYTSGSMSLWQPRLLEAPEASLSACSLQSGLHLRFAQHTTAVSDFL